MSYFPGEKEDIEKVKELGAKWGYGNLINRLKDAWAESAKESNPNLDDQAAARHAGHICVWCNTDGRTGKKVR